MLSRSLLGVGAISVLVAFAAQPAQAQDLPLPVGGDQRNACEPIVLTIAIDWSVFPPKIVPSIWIRPECVPV